MARESGRQSIFKSKGPGVHSFLAFSTALHLSVLGGMILWNALGPKPKVRVIRPSIRVDLVGLPDAKIARLKKSKGSPKPPPPEKTSEKSKAPDPKPTKKDLMAAIRNIKKQAPKKKTSGKKKSRGKKTPVKVEKLATSDFENLYKGNKIARGTGMTGDTGDPSAIFEGAVHQHVNSNWQIPVWLKDLKAQAVVSVRLTSSGKVLNYRFLKYSGNNQFDDAVEKAIKSSDPFPAPPVDLADAMQSEGITLGFPL